MVSLEMLFPVLDVLLAAVMAAWFLAFATTASTDRATFWMYVRYERVRVGALVIATGMLLDIAGVLAYLLGALGPMEVLHFLAYPFWIGGGVALASATWPVPSGHRTVWRVDT